MGVKSGATGAVWPEVGGGDVLEHLMAVIPASGARSGWRQDVLDDLNRVSDALIEERLERSGPGGAAALRERSHLLSVVGAQRLQVMATSDVDRLAYDLRRLVCEVRAHLRRGAGA